MEDLLESYNEGVRFDDKVEKVDRIMSRLDGRGPGSFINTGRFMIEKLSKNEFQLNYLNKDGIHKWITGPKKTIKDFLYQIEIGLILWQDNQPKIITDIRF